MGVNFYANSQDGKPFVPIEKWKCIEGPGGALNPKVDMLSARVWVDVINKALLCHSEYGFDGAFPYLKPLMELLDKPADTGTLDEFCSRTKALSTDNALIMTDHMGCHDRLRKLIQQLLDDAKYADTEEDNWRTFARLCKFYQDCIAIVSSYWLQHGQMLWEYVAVYAGVAHRDLQGRSDNMDIHTYWWFDAVSWDVFLLDTKLLAQSVEHAKQFIGPSFQHVVMSESFGQDWDYFISDNTFWLVRSLTRRPTISHLWGLYGDFMAARNAGRNFNYFDMMDGKTIKAMTEPVKRIGIINAFKNEAYLLELDSVPKNAEIVWNDMWKEGDES